MINLKLAESELKLAQYNEQGKFERFLELGKDFLIGDNYIVVQNKESKKIKFENIKEVLDWQGCDNQNHLDIVYLDKKDPLNRFNGLFNQNTY